MDTRRGMVQGTLRTRCTLRTHTTHITLVCTPLQGDALQPEQWRWVMQGTLGVVSCVGAFGSNEYMFKVCGCVCLCAWCCVYVFGMYYCTRHSSMLFSCCTHGSVHHHHHHYQQVNGDANAAIAQEAAAAGVPRMAYISAHDYQFPGMRIDTLPVCTTPAWPQDHTEAAHTCMAVIFTWKRVVLWYQNTTLILYNLFSA